MRLGDTVITYIESVVAAGEQQFDIIAARTAEVATLVLARAITTTTVSLIRHCYFTLLVKTSSIRPYSFASAAVSQ